MLPLNQLGSFRLVAEPLWASVVASGNWADRLPDRSVGAHTEDWHTGGWYVVVMTV